MKNLGKPVPEPVEPKITRILPTAELRSRKARKNVLKVTPMTPKPAKTIG